MSDFCRLYMVCFVLFCFFFLHFILCTDNLGIVFCFKFLIAFMGDIVERTIGKLLLRVSGTWSEMGKQNFKAETVCFLMFGNFY